MRTPSVDVMSLRKVYPGGLVALDGVSFSVYRGEILGLLGPNGAGKTTTIRIITGYLTPDQGDVEVEGISVTKDPARAKARIGYMPEILPFYPELTVKEYLAFRAGIKGIPSREVKKEIERVLSLAFIEDVAGRLIAGLSKGYRQRLGFADALLGNPPVLLLDEPTIGLDPNQTVRFRQVLRDLRGDHTILFSSHILAEVEAVCDRVVIIDRGRIVAQGDKEDLLGEGRKVEVEIRGEETAIRECLRSVSPDFSLELLNDGWYKALVSGEGDIREQVVRACCSRGLDLRKVDWERTSLERVFLSLTQEEGR